MADQSQNMNGPTVRAHKWLWSSNAVFIWYMSSGLAPHPWSITLGEAVWISGHTTVRQRTNSLIPLITLCGEAWNLITFIIILAWIATNVTNGHKIIQPFLKCKLQ